MSETQTIKRVENHTDHFILLPPTPTFTRGIRLVPGLNTVPVKYMSELDERVLESKATKLGGRTIPARERHPARDMWARLQKHVRLVDVNGTETWGPQVTLHDDIMADRQDGPPPPLTLPQNKDIARKILQGTTERAALERWSKQGRGELPALAKERLAELDRG